MKTDTNVIYDIYFDIKDVLDFSRWSYTVYKYEIGIQKWSTVGKFPSYKDAQRFVRKQLSVQ